MVEADSESGWLTYSEAAEVLGSSAEAVRRRARRYNWPRGANGAGVGAT